MQRKVFISYQHADADFAQMLCDELESQGVLCWIAPRNILPGDSWRDSIVTAVESTQVMALVFSSNTQISKQVKKELSIADECDAKMVPILIEDIDPQGEFKFQLTGTHWIRAVGGDKTAVKWATSQIKLYLDSLGGSTEKRPETAQHRPTTEQQPQRKQDKRFSAPRLTPQSIAVTAGFLALLALALLGFKAAFFNDGKAGSSSTATIAPNPPAKASNAAPAAANQQQASLPNQVPEQQVSVQPAPTQQVPIPTPSNLSAPVQVAPIITSPNIPPTEKAPSTAAAATSTDSAQVAPIQAAASTNPERSSSTQPPNEPEKTSPAKAEKGKSVMNLFRPPK
jgi:hypothetical protein